MQTSNNHPTGRTFVMAPALAILVIGAASSCEGDPGAVDEVQQAGVQNEDESPPVSLDTPASVPGSCEIHIGVTSQSGNNIHGYGSQSAACGSGGVSYLTIQRSRWWGWQDMRTAEVHDAATTNRSTTTAPERARTSFAPSTPLARLVANRCSSSPTTSWRLADDVGRGVST
jgi:hypothetical protein